MTQTVSFEIARLLKEKKQFVIDSGNYYSEKGDLRFCQSGSPMSSYCRLGKYLECFAPTTSEVVMWLYEIHGIWISVRPRNESKWKFDIYTKTVDNVENIQLAEDDNPTEAYESAIKYALNNIIK